MALKPYQVQAVDLRTNQPLPGAVVTIYIHGTSTKASLFDNSGVARANPIIADDNALAAFKAGETNYYQAVWSSGSYVSPLVELPPIEATAATSAAEASASATAAAASAASAASAVSDETAARIAADAALQADIDGAVAIINREQTNEGGRPGDAPSMFSASTTGRAEDMASLSTGAVVAASYGYVYRLAGAGVIAKKEPIHLGTGRIFQIRTVYRRTIDSSDPLNDAVATSIQWLSSSYAPISVTQAVVDAATVANGERVNTVVMPSETIAPPAGAVYARIFLQTYGVSPTTDVDTVAWDEVIGDAADAIELIGAKANASIVIAGGGLATGGGNLTANRTITVAEATQAEAEAGTLSTKAMTPRRASQHFEARTTTFSRTLLDDADAAAARTTLGAVGSSDLVEKYVDRIVLPGVGNLLFASVDQDGRIVEAAHADGRRWRAWPEGLLEDPDRVEPRIVVAGIGDVVTASVDQNGRALSAVAKSNGASYASSPYGLTRADSPAVVYDVVIYGASPSGIMAAMRAARHGLTICVVEPLADLGGVMAGGGLTFTDFPQYGHSDQLGGLTADFFARMATEYGVTSGLKQAFEAKVASRVLTEYLLGTGARIITDSPLDGPSHVSVRSGRIEAIRSAMGWIRGRTFVDASYEGDLYAAAGAPYHIGREAASEFGESLAGFRTSWGFAQTGVSPNNLYPVQTNPGLAEGDADGLVQAYSYRLTVTTASDRLPFPLPEDGYDASLMDQFVELINDRGDLTTFGSIVAVAAGQALPNSKWCINALRLLSIELPGEQHEYPDASWSKRWDIIARHRRWQMHVLYMLQNDARLDAGLRADANLYGLCADEWTHNLTPGWPDQLYIREARRLRGAYVMTQYDLLDADNPANTDGVRNSSKADSIGKFAYFMDGHSMALYAEGASTIRATGNSPSSDHDTDLYDVPFSCLHTAPGSGHIVNLLVPNCFSATSVAWKSMRMEPTFMMAGEAAGEACALMRETGQSVDQLDVSVIQSRLAALGSIL